MLLPAAAPSTRSTISSSGRPSRPSAVVGRCGGGGTRATATATAATSI